MNWVEIGSCFMVLFAVIDIVGSIPIILDTQKKTGKIKPLLITLISFLLMILFLFAGESILSVFGVDVYSFAVAGAFILFFIALEMILGIRIFKQKEASSSVAAVMPLAFPTIAGAGTISTLIALRAEYQSINIVIAILLNMPIIFLVLKLTNRIERILGPNGLAILEKMFGIILLAIALKLFSKNIGFLFPH
ncbi:MAG: MarC family protein [Sediminibacterium sp.]